MAALEQYFDTQKLIETIDPALRVAIHVASYHKAYVCEG